MAEKDYYSFDEVLKNLQMQEDELKRLVSAGEIRAFRDKDTMRFKAEDVQRLRAAPAPRDEVPIDELGDDLDLKLEDDLELEPPVVEPEPVRTSTRRAGASVDVEEIDLAEQAETETARAPRGAAGRRAARAAPAPEPEGSEGALVLAAMILSFVVLLAASLAVLDASAGFSSNAVTKALANMFQ